MKQTGTAQDDLDGLDELIGDLAAELGASAPQEIFQTALGHGGGVSGRNRVVDGRGRLGAVFLCDR